MKGNFKRIMCAALALSMASTMLSGCGKKKGTASVDTSTANYGTTYPLDANGDSLDLWIINSVDPNYSSYADMPFYQEVEKRTGVKLNIKGPTGGQFEESFNLMIASGELPDIILYDWADKKVAGGPSKYIKEGYILPLNDIIDAYAPNLKKCLAADPEIDKDVKTDDGLYYVFPYYNSEQPAAYAGPVVREDWLKDCGLEAPETVDDWYNMLVNFRDKKGATSPLIWTDWLFEFTGFLSGAYGTQQAYYLNDEGKIEYGPATQKWKQYLETVSKWYAEGLIDKDIATLDSSTSDSKIIGGKTGAFIGTGGSISEKKAMFADVDPKAKLLAVQEPVLNKGETPEFGICDNRYSGLMSSAITADCKNVELAAKFLDYFYSDEGRLLANFGIEGVTYNMVDGNPVLSDMVINSDDIQTTMNAYTNNEFSIVDPRYYPQRMVYPEQKYAIELWAKTNAAKHKLPVLLPTQAESDELTKYTTDIETYAEEMFIKFMIGTESLDGYDAYLVHLDELAMQKTLDIYNTVYERYKNR